jgi:benzoyl-CoA 2,3-dioxygenase component B
MLTATKRIGNFDDWVDYFHSWQEDLDVDPKLFSDYRFGAKFSDLPANEIEFGSYKGESRWETLLDIPDQRIRDSLLHLIVYQGDTEFASSEQQRNLLKKPPSNYDLQCAVRVMREEMRHGWQMSYLLCQHFGRSGKLEAQKLLERRAYEGTRLLGAFNQNVDDWLDYYCYTALVDRDGKYQLTMLSRSSFKPLASSMGPMLQEEGFHLLSGYTGLSRIIRADRVPIPVVQRHINKWYSAALDLFGVDHSNSARWFYVWGLKGRFNESIAEPVSDPDELNEIARQQYRCEVEEILQALNRRVPEGQPQLVLPDHRFNRAVGDFAGKPYSISGELLSPSEYSLHAARHLPSLADKEALNEIAKEPDWILPVGS